MKVMYIVVNKDLNMSPGKIAAQVGHGVEKVCGYYKYIWDLVKSLSPENILEKDSQFINDFLEWQIEGNSTKIVLGADTKTFTKLSRKSPELVVVDAGKTEIAPNTKTVICFWPMEKDSNKDIKRLQLL
jgi:peptidyl-tRNA hydrolase